MTRAAAAPVVQPRAHALAMQRLMLVLRGKEGSKRLRQTRSRLPPISSRKRPSPRRCRGVATMPTLRQAVWTTAHGPAARGMHWGPTAPCMQ